MFARQTVLIVGPVNIDMARNVLTEFIADPGKGIFVTGITHGAIREIGVHTGAIPICMAQRFGVPLNGQAVFFCCTLQNIPGQPGFVARAFGAFCKDLKLPLSRRHFPINAFNIESGFEADIKMILNDFATIGIHSAYGAIIRTLRAWKTTLRKAWRQVGGWVPKKIFLLKTKPEIIVIIFDSGTPI